MSTATPDSAGTSTLALPSRPRPPATAMKPQRVLACVQCQHRKIKCNREFPCSHCIKTGVQCIPAHLVPKQRRRRFPERELLDRVRHYEDLLKQHRIEFDPLHPSATATKEEPSPSADDADDAEDPSQDGPSITSTEEVTSPPASNFWSAITQTPAADDEDHSDHSGNDVDFTAREMGERMIKKAWEHTNWRKDDLIFGTPINDIDLSVFHPSPAHIFKLWQVYLDNVDQLLKVTHTPTLQPRIIDAIGNLANISPLMNALMFGIYCISITSLDDEECWAMFSTSKEDLLSRYQFGCQQALMQATFLRTEEIDCLTALYLYMISMKPDIDARSLASSMGIALRIAQRIGINDEAANNRCSALDCEIRRRLWWSLIIFDNRMCEMSNSLKSTMLLPIWDCKIPSNVSDFDMRAETKILPKESDAPSQAIFTVVRTQIADFWRHSPFYLNFNLPALKSIAKPLLSLEAFESQIETQYLSKCNPEDPLHFMTLWTARGLLAKNRFWEHLSRFPKPSVQATQTDVQRDTAVSHALRYLECDTQLLSSPLTKRFEWYIKTYSFFPAYIHIIQDLRKRPMQSQSARAWEVMSTDWKFRHWRGVEIEGNPFFQMFARIIMLAWEARVAAVERAGMQPEAMPGMVVDIWGKMTPKTTPEMVGGGLGGVQAGRQAGFGPGGQGGLQNGTMDIDDFLMNLMPMPIDWSGQSGPYDAVS